jgi:hypothetical protein
MVAELGDPPAVEHRDPVRPAHGREPVRDHHRGEPRCQFEEPVVERRLRPDVQLRRRLVEHQHPGPPSRRVQRPGQGDPLPLAAGQVGAADVAGGADRVPAGRQFADQLQRAGPGGRRFERALVDVPLIGTGADVAEPHVLPGRERIPGEVLVDHGDLALPRPGVKLADVGAIDEDPSASGLTQPGEKSHQRRFASSIDSHDGERRSSGQVQVEPFDHRPVASRILIADRLEPD